MTCKLRHVNQSKNAYNNWRNHEVRTSENIVQSQLDALESEWLSLASNVWKCLGKIVCKYSMKLSLFILFV